MTTNIQCHTVLRGPVASRRRSEKRAVFSENEEFPGNALANDSCENDPVKKKLGK